MSLRRLVASSPSYAEDRRRLLALNTAHQHLTGPLDEARLDRLLAWSASAWMIEDAGATAGFVITFPAGTGYDSANYVAHARLADDFVYLDRIVIDPAHRRRGLASAAYDELEAAAAPTGRLLLEVNVEPPNEPSLAFHRARGYLPVGELGTAAGGRVVLLAKTLTKTLTTTAGRTLHRPLTQAPS